MESSFEILRRLTREIAHTPDRRRNKPVERKREMDRPNTFCEIGFFAVENRFLVPAREVPRHGPKTKKEKQRRWDRNRKHAKMYQNHETHEEMKRVKRMKKMQKMKRCENGTKWENLKQMFSHFSCCE